MSELRIPPPCWHLFGAELVTMEAGLARVRMKASDDHVNPYGIVQGGLLTAMIENCMGPAVHSVEPGRQSSTVELKVNFLSALWPGETVLGEARVIHHGRTTVYVEASLTRERDGRLLARASATNVLLGEVPELPSHG